MGVREGHVAGKIPLLLLLAAMLPGSSGDLVMVYSIQRHGARNVLPKGSLLTENEATGGPTLLPQGQRQCYEAGGAFNNRYINPKTCNATDTCLAPGPDAVLYGVLNTPGVGFSNYNTFANTSALDRTIMSAESFLMGVFPPAHNATANSFLPTGDQLVPVYSVADTEDWKIRGYTKCPGYQQRLNDWLGSPEFKQKEAETATFRQKIQSVMPQLNTSLANWWNVYDAFNVWRTYGVGDEMPAVSDADYNQTVEIAMWLETRKMDPELTTNLLGGALIGDILAKMAAAEAATDNDSRGYYRLLIISSHYNTQLGVLSALQTGSAKTSYSWQSKIPSTAAVLVFELHKAPGAQGGDYVVRALSQDGPKKKYDVLPLPCAVKGDAAETFAGRGSCTLDHFRALAGPQAMNSSAAWCSACNNDKVIACALDRVQRQLMQAGIQPDVSVMSTDAAAIYATSSKGGSSSSSSSSGANLTSPGMVFVWCLVSVISAALLAAAGFVAVRRFKHRQHEFSKDSLAGTADHPL